MPKQNRFAHISKIWAKANQKLKINTLKLQKQKNIEQEKLTLEWNNYLERLKILDESKTIKELVDSVKNINSNSEDSDSNTDNEEEEEVVVTSSVDATSNKSTTKKEKTYY